MHVLETYLNWNMSYICASADVLFMSVNLEK